MGNDGHVYLTVLTQQLATLCTFSNRMGDNMEYRQGSPGNRWYSSRKFTEGIMKGPFTQVWTGFRESKPQCDTPRTATAVL